MPSQLLDVRVEYPGSRLSPNAPASVEIIQADYKHEMLVLKYYAERADRNRFRDGQPVHVRWGRLPNGIEDFYGYVLFTQPNIENDKHYVRVVCIGSSYWFKEASPRSASDATAEQVISVYANDQHFDVVRDASAQEWPSLMQSAEETTWEYFVRLAVRRGYTFFVHNTQVHFYDPVKVLLANGKNHPVLRRRPGFGNVVGNLISFNARLSDDGAAGLTNRDFKMLGVDPRSGEILGDQGGNPVTALAPYRADARFDAYIAGQPAHSSGEIAARLEGKQRGSRWVHQATANAYGNVRVRQGTGVLIDGTNPETNGLWYVTKVVHRLDTEQHAQQWRYFMDLDLRRDSREIQPNPVNIPERSPRQVLSRTDGVQESPRPTPSVLVDGRWRSAGSRTVLLA